MESSSVFGKSRIFQFIFGKIEHFILLERFASKGKILSLAKWFLSLMLFACIFIPRLSLGGGIHSSYRVDIRVEDIILLALTFLVLVLMSRQGPSKIDSARSKTVNRGVIPNTAPKSQFMAVLGTALPELPLVEKAFLGFLIAAQLSIFNGLFFGAIDKPFLSLLYFVKWFEYFLVFVIAARLTVSRKESLFFLKAFFLLGIAIAAYGYWEHFFPLTKDLPPPYYRLFERFPFHGDANHIGGLLVLWLGFFLGLFLAAENRSQQILWLGSLFFVVPPLIWTYSAKSYLALAGIFLFSFFFRTGWRKLMLLMLLISLAAFLLPSALWERLAHIRESLGSSDPYVSSWASNGSMWTKALWNFKQFFLFGSGLGSRHRYFYESQYVLVLAETGIVGFGCFLWFFVTLIRQALLGLRQSLPGIEKGYALGWLLGCIGLAIHSTTCVSWTVVKIAIPFWFLTGFVLARYKKTSL